MKKLIFSLLLSLITIPCFSQSAPQFNRTFPFTASGLSPVIPLQGLGLNYIKLSWDITGPVGSSLSACAFTLTGSQDGVNFGTTHDSVASCTTDGQNRAVAVTGATSFLQINVSSFTSSGGKPILTVTIAAWDEVIGTATTEPLIVAITPTTVGITAISAAMTSTLAATPFVIGNAGPAHNLYGWTGFNAAATVCFLQIFTTATPTVGVTVPYIVRGIAAGAATDIPPIMALMNVPAAGSSAALTTTALGSTPCGTPGIFTFFSQ